MPSDFDNIDFGVQANDTSDVTNDVEKDIESEVPNLFDECDEELVYLTGTELIDGLTLDSCFKQDNNGVTVVLLPDQFCQGSLSGRNGSSACTIINLLTGYCIITYRNFPNETPDKHNAILTMFIGCMEIGNIIQERNDTSVSMTVEEGIDQLPENIQLELLEETNSYLSPENKSLLVDVVKRFIEHFDNHTFMIIIYKEKSYCILKNVYLLAFDSHANPPFGARIAFTNTDNYVSLINDFFPFDDSNIIYTAVVRVEQN